MSVHPPEADVARVVEMALAEDLGPSGDVTASLVAADATATGAFVAREAGVLAGFRCVSETFARVDGSVTLTWLRNDGDELEVGTQIARVSGKLASILTAERTALNLMCHLSGIATSTHRFVEEVAARANADMANVKIRDTRKTTPGLRALEKAAVRAGGGVNHRFGLSDGILIKDNHLSGTSITDAVRAAKASWPDLDLEVECDREDQVIEAVAAGAPMVLLDNMSPAQVELCARIAHAGGVLVEVSGGITLGTVGDFAAVEADMISVGAITHSAPILDIGLDLDLDQED